MHALTVQTHTLKSQMTYAVLKSKTVKYMLKPVASANKYVKLVKLRMRMTYVWKKSPIAKTNTTTVRVIIVKMGMK